MTANPSRHVDVAIIGAGTAGLTARRSAKSQGASVLMIDPGPFGTTCARVGCMPSKLLIAAAESAHHIEAADQFGLQVENIKIDGPAVLGRVQRERDRFVGFVLEVIEEARAEGELLVGRARILKPGHLEVAGVDGHSEHVSYEKLVIATGTAPFIPPPFRGLESALLTNEGIFELKDLPESLVVVGLGAIGLELGQAFHRLGVRTTLLGTGGNIGPISDPEIKAEAARLFTDELDLHADYELKSAAPDGSGLRLRFVDSRGREREEYFEKMLMAAGRRPTLDRLGIAALGIAPDERGRYQVDPDTLQLGETPVFLAGDVNGLHPLLHEAADDGRIAGENAARFPEVRAVPRRTPLGIVFSDPQLAIVGQSYRALDDCQAVAGEVDFGDQGRARVHGQNRGKLRVYGDRHSGRLLGAEMIGPRAEHLAHLLAWAIAQGMTVEQALSMPFYHPVIEEGLRTALRGLKAAMRQGATIKCRVSELGVGS